MRVYVHLHAHNALCFLFVVAPNPPINVMSGSITSRAANITWQDGDLPNPVNPMIELYTLYLNGTQATEVNVSLTTTTLTGLIPFTYYVVTVVANNRIGNSIMSVSHSFTTMEEGKVLLVLLPCSLACQHTYIHMAMMLL